MQRHIEEYSMTDMRYTLGEVWRVVRQRKWYFIAPFCTLSTIALLCSLWVPRTYTAKTIIKREQDPVLASVMGQAWTQPYGEIRKRVGSDISDIEFVTEALDELDLPRDLARFNDGELTPLGVARRAALAREVIEGLTVTSLDSSSSRDIVEISLKLRHAEYLNDILTHLREKYVALAKNKTVSVLRDAQEFFQGESEKCRTKLTGIQKQIREYEAKYPGIDPQEADPTHAEQAALLRERVELEEKLEELTAQRVGLIGIVAKHAEDSGQSAGDGARQQQIANPRIKELEDEIRRIEDEILVSRTVRQMTDVHPTVVRLRMTLEQRREELSSLPRMIEGVEPLSTDTLALREQAEARLAHTDAKLTAVGARLEDITRRVDRIERRRIEAADHRDAYMKLRQSHDRASQELEGWQSNLGPIGHVLAIEDSNRGILFSVLQETTRAAKPLSPDALLVLLVCLGIGGAAGAVTVVIAELLDHSFQTVRQIGSVLGIPVIESIDEIMTAQRRKRRMLRQLVLMPAIATTMVAVVLTACAVAYLSIESPERFEEIRQAPHRAYRIALDDAEM